LASNVIDVQNNSKLGIRGGSVSGTFLGSVEGSITNRRVSIPQSFRSLIALSARMLVVAVRGRSNTIYIFPMDFWKKLEQDLEQGTDKEKQLLKMFRVYATVLKIEGPGRILLPKKLLEIAEIENKIVFLGEGKFFSIWNPDNFQKYEEEIAQQYDEKLQENELLL
jgi:division/cell wall cluster transcriptional repressor MraZ